MKINTMWLVCTIIFVLTFGTLVLIDPANQFHQFHIKSKLTYVPIGGSSK